MTLVLTLTTPLYISQVTDRVVSRGGGYILSSSNTIHPGVKPENFLAMIKAGKEYGVYQ